ncbi:MAG: hypothetical protein GF393_08105, partial [Armatimonadia bacterium]|nr:hypothetical protein [Armatimonadia bacterium]
MTGRVDFDEDPGFEPQSSWLGNASEDARIEVADGVASFIVPEPGHGMKWTVEHPERPDVGFHPWLVIRYRAVNYDPAKPDYLVWVKTDGDEMRLLQDRIAADGEWHTVAVNVLDRGSGTYVRHIAVQTQADEAGEARLDVDWIAFADVPPEGVETAEMQLGPDRVAEFEAEEMQFAPHPDWLSNPAEDIMVEPTDAGMRFSVAEAGRGMKWSADLGEPVEGARWLAVRYRARGVRRIGDYFAYIAETGGGSSEHEQYCILLNDITSNGSWNVAIGAVEVAKIGTLAVQVQAAAANASVEIDSFRFSRHRPERHVSDTLAIEPLDAAPPGPLHLPDGDRSLSDLFRVLGFDDSLEAGAYTVEDVPFAVDERPPVTALIGDDAVSIDVGRPASEVLLLLGLRAPQTEEESYGGGALRSVTQPHRFLARLHYADGGVREIFPISARSGKYEIERGLGVYVVPADPDRALERVELSDTMDRGSLGVLAATLRGPGEAMFTQMRPAPTPPRPVPVMREAAAGAPEITVDGDRVLITGQRLHAEMDASNCMAITTMGTDYIGGPPFEVEPEPLFALVVDGEEIPPEAFRLDRHGLFDGDPTFLYSCEETAVGASVRLDPHEDGSVVIYLAATNRRRRAADIELHGPR